MALFLMVPAASAGDASAVSAGDTSWVLLCAALVMLMVPGLALFYGGMVRHKNVLATLMQCMVLLALVSLQWALLGYSLAFGPDVGGVIGNLSHAFLNGVSASEPDPAYAATIPALAFVLFQAMFAAITPALIIGAFAERMSFKALIVFGLLWSTLVYDAVAHWVWGTGGWLRSMGALDFAGGTVVHITAGVAALACVLYMGKRKGFGQVEFRPNNIPLTILGAGLLWFGWFGFNAGSALAAGPLAVSAFAATHLAAAAAALAWASVEWSHKGKPTVVGAAAGIVAGLVAITPASGFVTPMAAILIGLAAGCVCYLAVTVMKSVLRLDDSLDAFGVHGIGGMLGALSTGLFATVAVNAAGTTGLLSDAAGGFAWNAAGWHQVLVQLVAIGAVIAYTFLATWLVLWVTDQLVGLRVPEAHEDAGLDFAEHGEVAYHYPATPNPQHSHVGDASLVLGTLATGRARER
ncbi:MAG: ammonium transporter [Candidatus Thermoplasmatota archaeon]